jgi:hypothetical protein
MTIFCDVFTVARAIFSILVRGERHFARSFVITPCARVCTRVHKMISNQRIFFPHFYHTINDVIFVHFFSDPKWPKCVARSIAQPIFDVFCKIRVVENMHFCAHCVHVCTPVCYVGAQSDICVHKCAHEFARVCTLQNPVAKNSKMAFFLVFLCARRFSTQKCVFLTLATSGCPKKCSFRKTRVHKLVHFCAQNCAITPTNTKPRVHVCHECAHRSDTNVTPSNM